MRGIRVIIGFVLACLAAAVTLVLFVYTPAEFSSLPTDMRTDRLGEAGQFALAVVPHVATFAAFFAVVGVVIAEARGIGSWSYYVLVGVGIAVAGFLVQHFNEAPGDASILQNYALVAFLVAGVAGGLIYWAASGRYSRPR